MELVLSAISAGGLVGAGDQYLCLMIVSIAAKTNLVELTPQMRFMESWWFLGIVVVFWLLTVAPAYASLLSPGVMNAINAVVNFLSGFLVPASGALLALASIGIIAEMHADLAPILQTLGIFTVDGAIGSMGWLTAGGGAAAASTLNGARFLAKPALSASTGTTGTISAPTFATVENITSVVLMALLYVLTRIDPWLLVALIAVVTLVILGILGYALYQLWRLGKGIGKVIRLIETHPKAGLSVVAESLVWGSGWMIWQNWQRGAVRLTCWGVWLLVVAFGFPVLATALAAAVVTVPPLVALVSVFSFSTEVALIAAGLYAGLRSARSLFKDLERSPAQPYAPPTAAPYTPGS
ncbi:MAG: DUF4126 family protein [Anaerolineae bacterium]|nr:DUF4126 family protein [Anaerolineae bacterium]